MTNLELFDADLEVDYLTLEATADVLGVSVATLRET